MTVPMADPLRTTTSATRRLAAIALCLLAWGGCNGSAFDAAAPAGTLVGEISVGPFCPVEIEGQPCPPPPGTYRSIVVLVYARLPTGERLVAEVRPDDDGRFELALQPGPYRVTLEHSVGIPGAPRPEQEIRVQAGRATALAFHVDTGIR